MSILQIKPKRIVNILLLLIVFCLSNSYGQESAQAILDKSINYHDPNGLLAKKQAVLNFTETRPNGSDRKTVVMLHPAKEAFEMNRTVDNNRIITTLNKGKYSHTFNGQLPSEDQIEKYRLTDERSDMMRTYYHYLWYMPMKLKDPGTIIHEDVKRVDFFGKESLQIKVTYESAVGEDIWYFYFNPNSYALIGYRFYHDESVNDGEYILFEGEATYKSVRIPKSRTWYTHKEDKLLGTDILDRLIIK